MNRLELQPSEINDVRRQLPSVDAVLRQCEYLIEQWGITRVVMLVRSDLENL